MKILITGGTGFIGKKLVSALSVRNFQLYLLTRKVSKSQNDDYNVRYVVGDLNAPELFASPADRRLMLEEVDAVIHLAAVYDLKIDYQTAYQNNVEGTRNLLAFAQAAKHIKYFHHISSVAAGGIYNGEIQEDQFPATSIYPDNYSLTKMLSEKLVRDSKGDLKYRIYRPGIVIGDSQQGEIDRIDGPYYLLKLLKSLTRLRYLLLPLPFDPQVKIPLIPIDLLVDYLVAMIISPRGEERVRGYHLIPRDLPSVFDVVYSFFKYAKIMGKIYPMRDRFYIRPVLKILGMPSALADFMYNRASYSRRNLERDYPHLPDLKFASYQENFFKGAMRFLSKNKIGR